METIRYTTTLTLEDWQLCRRALVRRYWAGMPRWAQLLRWIPAVVVVGFMAWLLPGSLVVAPAVAVLVLAAMLVVQHVVARIAEGHYRPDPGSPLLGSCEFEFSAAGIRTIRDRSGGWYAWSCVRRIERDDALLYVWIDSTAVLYVPLRDCGGALTREALERGVREWFVASHAGAPAMGLPTANRDVLAKAPDGAISNEAARNATADAAGSLPGPWSTTWRLWTLRSVRAEALSNEWAIFVLALAALGSWLLFDRIAAGSGAVFTSWGIPELGLLASLPFLFAFAMARLSTPRIAYVQALFIAMVAALLVTLLVGLAQLTVDWSFAALFWVLVFVYLALYVRKALHSASGTAQRSALIVVLAMLIGAVGFCQVLNYSPTLWYIPDEDDAAVAVAAADLEAAQFSQRARIDERIAAIPAGEQAARHVYFVGFAGVGSQRVFAEEIKLAERVVDRRFDIGARQLLLINDQRDEAAFPLASVTGLRYALARLATRMNPERDILFLALSSHGSDDPELSVQNGSLPLQQLSPEDLAELLDAAGIRNRIIVVSACYAGGFVPALEDADTIVIAAAAADRTSFGCSNDRNLTYFGEAFYRDALPGAATLKQAFADAKSAIEQRERRENIEASKPQAWFGEDLTRLLERLPARLEAAP